MPYGSPASPAPSKKPVSPAGATVAGPIRYAPPETLRGKPLAELQAEAQAKVQVQAPLLSPSRLGWGYLALRLSAFLIDGIAHLSLSILILMGVLALLGHAPMVLFEPGIIEAATVFALVLAWSLSTAQEVALGSTPGKRMLGLRLDGSAGLLFLRSILFVPSVLLMGSGVLWSLLNRERRCWHDAAVGIQPMRPLSR
jgi:uncharacterized RDD family membrane protein YckC